MLTQQLEVLVLQTLEVGPIAQAVAGIDIAMWDLFARKAGQPLNRYLGGTAATHVPVYATGINPDQPEVFAAARRAEGPRAFKLKTGFGHARDVRNLQAMREAIGPDDELTCDANQVLDVEQAIAFARDIAPLKMSWFEEPIRVDAPAEHWRRLAAASTTPLAGGENLQVAQFDAACADRVLQVIQPDVTKWGGITGSIHIARAAVAAGKRYCPHYFGGGVSLLASLHVLAAAGGTGLLEHASDKAAFPHVADGERVVVDLEAVVGDLLPVHEGRVPVPAGAGLGAVPDLAALRRYRTWPL
jgi:L-alanine-DL-glutamate epimerase-like enolase superfamily enzyme